MNKRKIYLVSAMVCLLFSNIHAQVGYKPVSVNYINLSDDAIVTAQPIQTKKLKISPSKKLNSPIEIQLHETINSHLSGIGGAFNEQGGEAFMSLNNKSQKDLVRKLFNVKKGIGFSMCRTAVGSSDFGLDAYSYNET
ncbi:MAG: hypothetical protein WCS34_08165, partial [Bacteroidales bacterium]